MSPEYTANSYWDSFVDFAFAKKLEHEWLFPAEIEKTVFDQMLAFHFHNKNLYVTRAPDGWAFSVIRPVRSAWDYEFDWKQPETTLYLLDFLYSKCKKATVRLWTQFYERGIKPTGFFYFRRQVPKPLNARLLKKLFYEVVRKED